MVGCVLVPLLQQSFEVIALEKAALDITDYDQVVRTVLLHQPDIIIHLAALTNLDLCETDHALADQINIQGTRHVVDAAKESNAIVVFLSSDAVYSFDAGSMNGFSEDSPCDPPNYYGYTKLAGEKIVQELVEKHYIIRTTWLFGGPKDKKFLSQVLPKLERGETVRIVNDVWGSPTYTVDLGQMIGDLLQKGIPYGTYNVVNDGVASRYEMACYAAQLQRLDPSLIIPVSQTEFPQALTRQTYAILQTSKITHELYAPRFWEDAMAEYLQNL